MTAPAIVLVGPMGSGKTSVGTALATRLGRDLLDNDVRFRAETGATPREYASAHGDHQMHAIERRLILTAITLRAVVVTAPGSVADPPAIDDALAAAGAFVVLLTAPIEVLAARVAGSSHRPLLETDALIVLTELQTRRDAAYERMADLVIDTTENDPAEAAATIATGAADVTRGGQI